MWKIKLPKQEHRHIRSVEAGSFNHETTLDWLQNEKTKVSLLLFNGMSIYRGADKSLARPGRKQATKTEDFEFHIYYL